MRTARQITALKENTCALGFESRLSRRNISRFRLEIFFAHYLKMMILGNSWEFDDLPESVNCINMQFFVHSFEK